MSADNELITTLQKLNTELQEALENMLGAFDTPMSRCRENSEFANEARKQARDLIEMHDEGIEHRRLSRQHRRALGGIGQMDVASDAPFAAARVHGHLAAGYQ